MGIKDRFSRAAKQYAHHRAPIRMYIVNLSPQHAVQFAIDTLKEEKFSVDTKIPIDSRLAEYGNYTGVIVRSGSNGKAFIGGFLDEYATPIMLIPAVDKAFREVVRFAVVAGPSSQYPGTTELGLYDYDFSRSGTLREASSEKFGLRDRVFDTLLPSALHNGGHLLADPIPIGFTQVPQTHPFAHFARLKASARMGSIFGKK